MVKQKKNPDLSGIIVEAIKEKKGEEIIKLDLTNLSDAICDNFIICHGNSHPQVRAIADEIRDKVKENKGEVPWFTEGYDNEEWIILDYFDTVVHVFLRNKRYYYNIEELWCDANITNYSM